ncbi:MAG: hypothetical protein KDB37_05575 [Ilumatobacter sp.]|nr:hypothetical protein [Ilumatobacter sp.]
MILVRFDEHPNGELEAIWRTRRGLEPRPVTAEQAARLQRREQQLGRPTVPIVPIPAVSPEEPT